MASTLDYNQEIKSFDLNSIKEICLFSMEYFKISKSSENVEPLQTIIDQAEKTELKEICTELFYLIDSNAFRLKLITYIYPVLVDFLYF
jgi:hypothetical protein